jgi:hypothetical protein
LLVLLSPLRHLPDSLCAFGSPRSALYTRLAALVKLSTSEWRHTMGVPNLSRRTLIRLESLHVTWCNAGPWSKRLLRGLSRYHASPSRPLVIVESRAIDTNDRLGYAHVETSTAVTGTVNQTLHGDATIIQGPKLTSGRPVRIVCSPTSIDQTAGSSAMPHHILLEENWRPPALPCAIRVAFKIYLCSNWYPCRAWVGSRGMSAPVDHRYLQ